MADSSRPTLGAARARQGRSGRPILWVLLIALAGAVAALFGAWAWKSGDLARTNPNSARQPANVAAAFSAPPPAGASRQNYREGGPLAPQNGGNPGQPAASR